MDWAEFVISQLTENIRPQQSSHWQNNFVHIIYFEISWYTKYTFHRNDLIIGISSNYTKYDIQNITSISYKLSGLNRFSIYQRCGHGRIIQKNTPSKAPEIPYFLTRPYESCMYLILHPIHTWSEAELPHLDLIWPDSWSVLTFQKRIIFFKP